MTNYERLQKHIGAGKPFIVLDVQTTGAMNGNDNRITQIALAKYEAKNGVYEMQDSLFMLAKPNVDVMRGIRQAEVPSTENAQKRLGGDWDYHNRTGVPMGGAKYRKTREEFITDEALIDEMREKIRAEGTLTEILKLQGIDEDTWVREGEGLTSGEMAIGIAEFFKRYDDRNVAVVSNGTYFVNHYLSKENIHLPERDEDKTIDLTQAERSRHGGKTSWTADIATFAEHYSLDTGKQIKTFDALTRAMCMGEIACSAVDVKVSHNSLERTIEEVKTSAFKQDGGYVLSASRANKLVWQLGVITNADYVFDSLEYVEFGNDRRYVDIDMMFAMNDNFEITLEGDKTPIKTWEELEAKIKALNAHISKNLLDRIKDKYEEISREAEKVRPKESVESPDMQFLKRFEKIKARNDDLLRKMKDTKDEIHRIRQISEDEKKAALAELEPFVSALSGLNVPELAGVARAQSHEDLREAVENTKLAILKAMETSLKQNEMILNELTAEAKRLKDGWDGEH